MQTFEELIGKVCTNNMVLEFQQTKNQLLRNARNSKTDTDLEACKRERNHCNGKKSETKQNDHENLIEEDKSKNGCG